MMVEKKVCLLVAL
jgi:hypothetical protein